VGLERGALVTVAAALSSLDALAALLASLGRRRGAGKGGLRWREHLGTLSMSRASPSVIEGVGRSGELSRMLASEASLLAHAGARRLFLARWAERSLMSYDARATEVEPDPRAARGGPVLVLLDTSGSMFGPSELVAKGVVLQLLTTAFQSRRAIVVLSFSGTEQLLEHHLSHELEGLERAIEFLGSSFYGGTELDTALTRAFELLDEDALSDADLLVVTDDAFLVSEASVERLASARREGLRVAGISSTASTSRLEALGADPATSVEEWLASIG
jgi:uncharacterized protein with von Willebrand factor type A (vWA) domain